MSTKEHNLEEKEYALDGGNMNSPVKSGEYVIRKTSEFSPSIHQLLLHLESYNYTWIPKFHGLTEAGDEKLSFIEGEVPHDMPDWIWNEQVIIDVARAMRKYHDATVDLVATKGKWFLPNNPPVEVICHNDFAPYNCVFRDRRFVGVIDFDVCSPGSRLWDISYTIYRFVPFMPSFKKDQNDEIRPFSRSEIEARAALFLKEYSGGDSKFHYTLADLTEMISRRLSALAVWTKDFADSTGNETLQKNSIMYKWHSEWVKGYFK